MLAALLFACQCASTAPRATFGVVGQNADAIFLVLNGFITRVDKTTGEQRAVSPPPTRNVSAIDADGETVYFGTNGTLDANVIASIDAAGVQTTVIDHRRAITEIHHDAAWLYWTEDFATTWRRPRDGGAAEIVAVLDRAARKPPMRITLPRVSEYARSDAFGSAFGPWVIYHESVWYDPHVSAVADYALNLCDAAPPQQLWSAGYHTTPPVDPIPQAPPMAIDSCGIFAGAERKVCFAPQAIAIDALEIFLDGLAASSALRSAGGDLVIVHGRGFDAATTVDIDGRNAPVLFWSGTALSVAAPKLVPASGPVTVPLRVRNGGGDCTAEVITLADPRRHASY